MCFSRCKDADGGGRRPGGLGCRVAGTSLGLVVVRAAAAAGPAGSSDDDDRRWRSNADDYWQGAQHTAACRQPRQVCPPRAGSGVVRIDPLRFLAGCRNTRRLNQALSVPSVSPGCLSVSVVLLIIGPLFAFFTHSLVHSVRSRLSVESSNTLCCLKFRYFDTAAEAATTTIPLLLLLLLVSASL